MAGAGRNGQISLSKAGSGGHLTESLVYLAPAVLCGLAAAGIFLLSRETGFRYFWLVAAVAALVVWAAALTAWFLFPPDPGTAAWTLGSLLEPSLAIRWDGASASLSLAFTSLLLAVILTDVQRGPLADWQSWGGSLLVVAVVMAGLLSGSLFTLAILMGLLDLVIVALQLTIHSEQIRINLALRGLVFRGAGIFLLLFGAILDRSPGGAEGQGIETVLLIVFLSAFFLRLGILPLRWAALEDHEANRGFGSLLRFAPAGLALTLLLRAASSSFSTAAIPWVLGLMAFPSILAAWLWVRSSDEVSGRSFFISAAAAIGAAAVLTGGSDTGLVWALAFLLSGGVLFLFKTRKSWFILLPLLGFWGFTGLPISASWPAMRIYSAPFQPVLALYLVLQAVLLTGYLFHTLRVYEGEEILERWEQVLYPVGLLLLPVVNLLLAWIPWQGMAVIQTIPWWPGFVITAIGAGLWWLTQRIKVPSPDFRGRIQRIYRLPGSFAREALNWMERVINFLSFLLEGEGGVLWALLFLALMITFLSQVGLAVVGNGN